MSDFSSFIKAVRENADLSLREAAGKTGISNPYLNQMENGQIHKPSTETLIKLANGYNIPYDLLLEKTGYALSNSGFDIEVLKSGSVIVIVDDNEYDIKTYIRHLTKEGFNPAGIFTAETGSEGIDAIIKNEPDCVILDYRLPDKDGLEVLSYFKTNPLRKKTSIIIITGMGNETIAVEAIKNGAADYLVKSSLTQETLANSVLFCIRNSLIRNFDNTKSNDPKNDILRLLIELKTIIADTSETAGKQDCKIIMLEKISEMEKLMAENKNCSHSVT